MLLIETVKQIVLWFGLGLCITAFSLRMTIRIICCKSSSIHLLFQRTLRRPTYGLWSCAFVKAINKKVHDSPVPHSTPISVNFNS